MEKKKDVIHEKWKKIWNNIEIASNIIMYTNIIYKYILPIYIIK